MTTNAVPSTVRSVLRVGDKTLGTILFHLRTLWLFTYSDLKTIVIPSTVFGLTNALAADRYGIPAAHDRERQHHHPGHPWHDGFLQMLIRRAPLVLLWVWLNFLPFAINNQLDPESVAEDSINKPWRPLPTRRITPRRARLLMLALYASAMLGNLAVLGGPQQGASLVLLGTWYNNLGGADRSPLVRNAINALGYVCFTSGALEVALGTPLRLLGGGGSAVLQGTPSSWRLPCWLGVLAGIIVTTVHAQDLYDQEGDAMRGRRTVPLVIGDAPARWIIAVAMLVWGSVCPRFWHATPTAWGVTLGLAALVGLRVLAFRGVDSDRKTFLIWNIWMLSVYVLPLCGTK